MTRVFVIVALLAGIAQATSYAPVEAHDEGSPNGAFTLHVDPKGKMLTVRTGTTLWQAAHDLGSEQFFLANDGKTLAIVR